MDKINIDYFYFRCTEGTNAHTVMEAVLKYFEEKVSRKTTSIDGMLDELHRIVCEQRKKFIIIIDEAHLLLTNSGDGLINDITRINYGKEKTASISLCLVSHKNILRDMDEATISSLGRCNVIELKEYKKEQLEDILKQRVELAFYPATVSAECIEFIADVAKGWGDARYAIEILERSGLDAEESGLEQVTPECIRAAKAMTHPYISSTKLRELELPEKLILLAIARKLKKDAYTTTGEAERTYRIACEEHEQEWLAHTQFWEKIKRLSALGILETKKVSSGYGEGRTTVISLPDIPMEELIPILERLIEDHLKDLKIAMKNSDETSDDNSLSDFAKSDFSTIF